MTYDSLNETDRLQQDLKQMLNRCDALFAGAMQQERKNVNNLRSAFLMMRDMGYTAEEAKDEFTRFQAEYNLDTSKQPGSDNGVRVCVQRRKRTGTNTPEYGMSKKSGLTGAQRFGRVFTLCLVAIPVLFVVGLVTEIWFCFNPWRRALFNVRYGKAVLYLITWYLLLSTCMPKLVTKVLMTFFCFVGIGMVLSCEPVIDAWGIGLWAGAWILLWVKLQWWYCGLLAITYLYAWWKLAHGPRYWIMKYGVG